MTENNPEPLQDELVPMLQDLVDLWSWINSESDRPEADRREAVRRIRPVVDDLERDLEQRQRLDRGQQLLQETVEE